MKYLIYQYYFSLPKNERTNHIMDDSNSYWEWSRKSIEAYSKKYNIEYKFMDERHPVSPFYSIFNPFTEGWAKDYDAVCWIDADFLATTHAKNVFDVSANDCISANFMNTQNRWRGGGMFEWWKDKGHINSGVVVFPRAVYEHVEKWVGGDKLQKEFKNRTVLETSLGNFDQAIVNKIVRDHNKYKMLDDTYNYHLGRKPKEKRFDMDLIHYHRAHKPMLIKDFNDERILK